MVIGICDDQAEAIELIENICRESAVNELQIKTFTSGENLLEYVRNTENTRLDLLFLDIELGGIDGIQVKDEVIKCYNVWRIVFVSSFREKALEGFGLKTLGFVNKPAGKEEILKWINVVQTELEEDMYLDEPALKQYIQEEIKVEDILYFKAAGSYVEIHVTQRRKNPIIVTKNLKYIEAHTKEYPFIRVHKSYIVNMKQISNMRYGQNDKKFGIKLRNEEEIIPVGREYEKQAKEKYREYVRLTMRRRV